MADSNDIKCLRKHLEAAWAIMQRLEKGAEIKKAPKLSKQKQTAERVRMKYSN